MQGTQPTAPANVRPNPLRSYADLNDVDLKEALLTLWRRKWLIVTTTLIVAGLTAIIVSVLTPLYTANVRLLLEDDRIELLPGLVNPVQATEQVQVISSRVVAQGVIDSMGLRNDDEFNPGPKPDPLVVQFWNRLRMVDWAAFDFGALVGEASGEGIEQLRARDISSAAAANAITDELQSRIHNDKIVDNFLDRLTVETVETSSIIEISFVAEQPAKAARIADQIADTYLEQRLNAQFAEIQRTSGWLDARIAELRDEVALAEGAVEDYRRRTGLVESDRGGTVAAQQITELNSQLIEARTARAEREARLAQVRRLLGAGEDGLGSAVGVLNSPLINTLVEQEVELRRRIADLSQVYGSRHPQLLGAQAELANLQEKLRLEVARVAEGLQAELNVARQRERLLEDGLAQLESRVADSNEASVSLRALEREAGAARTLLETFLQQSQQLKSQDDLGLRRADASIVSYAAIPSNPSFPKKKLAVAAAIVVGGLIGVMLALVLERMDGVFRGAAQVEESLGIPVIASVPDLRRNRRVRKLGLSRYLLENTNSGAGEALRTVNARMLMFRGDRPTVALQFVSADPEEGKSSLAIATAQMHAKAGRRVLLIDADFRQSSVASALDVATSPGLTELMARQQGFDDVIKRDELSGAHVITSGRFIATSHDDIASGRLAEVIKRARTDYELIIVDSPPVLSVADATLISRAVDGSIFVSRWGKTRKETAAFALRQLAASSATIVGVVLSFVDVRRAASYSYGEAGQYYGKHQKYYLDKA